MTPDLFQRSREIFGEAADMPREGREAFLREACADDAALRDVVEALLSESESAPLEDGVRDAMTSLDAVPEGTRIGPYELVAEIGRGGMGTVHLARRADDEFQRDVAIKLVGSSLDPAYFLERFREERQILASLAHPNIASLLDGGTTEDGRPYLVMELVSGRPIDAYCREEGVPLEGRLRLFRDVCAAVQHAHGNLVVHRDLKPSNILVTDGGVSKLLDFGLARLLTPEAGADRTATQYRLLTPAFASPEQVRGDPISTASDVYALGVLLYLLVSGRKPYRATPTEDYAAVLHAVLTEEPLRMAVAAPGAKVPGDLEAIALKALRKESRERYGSVDALSADVERFLGGRPVAARRGGTAYRAKKFARRHWVGLTAAVLVLASLVFGLLLANSQRRIAERRFDDVRNLAKTVMFDLHDSIAVLPGATKAREKLVQTGLAYADALSSESSLNPDLQREIAAAYARLGSVQGGGNSNLGDAEGARNSYRKAVRIGEALVASREANDQDRLRLANAYAALGSGDTFEADCGKAIEIERNVLSRNPRDFDARHSLATAYACLSTGHKTRGELPRAMDERQSAHRLLEELASEKPDNPAVRRDLALSCKYLGGLLHRNGDLSGALLLYEQAVAIDEKRLRADPNDAQARLDLSFSLGSLSTGLATTGDLVQAVAFRQRANELREAIAAADPADKWANVSLAQGLGRLAGLQARSADHESSRASWTRSLSLLQTWLQKDPGNVELQTEVVIAEVNLSLADAALARGAPSADRARLLADARERLQKSGRDLDAIRNAAKDATLKNTDLDWKAEAARLDAEIAGRPRTR